MLVPWQNIDTEKLHLFGIYELRNIARALGVPHPTTLLRSQLIEQIKNQIYSHKEIPCTPHRGRPPRETSFNIAQILEQEPPYSSILEIPDNFLSPGAFEVRSSLSGIAQTRTLNGYFHLIPRGNGVLISSCLGTYHIPAKLITANQLETGDRLETKAVWNGQEKRYVIEEINDIRRIPYDSAESIRPRIELKSSELEFKLGNRVIINSTKPHDRVRHTADICLDIKEAYKIVLLVEESDDCIEYLRKSGVNEVYLTKVDLSLKKQVLLALTALFNAKEHAAKGHNVLFFVDNLNKLFRVYNTCVTDSGSFSAAQINIGPLTDLKTFFMSAKQIKDGGSLTVILYSEKPSTETENFIVDEFTSITNVCYKIATDGNRG
jgi:transcription termination factor Rho